MDGSLKLLIYSDQLFFLSDQKIFRHIQVNAKCIFHIYMYVLFCAFFLLFEFFTRTRLPPDRDPRHGNAPFFGIQMAPDCEGIIRLGDPVFISS